jgi:hypothetical protein
MQCFLNLFIFTDALRVSGRFSAHHQEHITVHTALGIVNQILLLAATVEEMELHGVVQLYVQLCALDDGRRSRLKHVERL